VAEKEGYAHQSQNLSSGMNPLVLGGNLVLGGLYLSPFFTTTDHSNGSLYKYSPNSFHFTMGAPNGQVSRTVAPAPAPVAAPVATPSSRGNDGNIPGLERAVEEAAHRVLANVRGRPRIAIVDINAMPRSVEDVITGELEDIWVNQGYTVVDRSQLDRLRAEQRLQHGGEVDERKAVSIGKLSGANIIIIGSLDGTGDQRRFRLRAIDVQTAEVVGSAIERLEPRQ
jgi:curli biogenesis system outer membrane secretion channel CsgG